MSTTSTIELVPPTSTAKPMRIVNNEPQILTSDEALPPRQKVEGKGSIAVIITTITGVTMISSLLSGLVTVSLPAMVRDLEISESLMLWPASIYSLTCGCTLILSGAVADVVGSRTMYLIGTFLQTVFTLACGLSKTSTQLIVFRALAGIAIAFCLPSAVSLIMTYFVSGRRRNIAFGTMGGGQPIGFTVGLVVGGVMADAVGWQSGFYLAAGINAVLFLLALFGLPKLSRHESVTISKLKKEIDWIGAIILSASLATLLYVFATWTGSIANIRSAESISCLVTGGALLPTFIMWEHRQEKLNRAVLIRNSLWRNKAFTSICINVFLIWGSFNAIETFLTFLFQDVHHLSATGASIRFLPEAVMGATINILIGLFIHRVRASWTLQSAFILSAVSPLLLALMPTGTSYWSFEFPAVALVPVATDVLFTISQLIITAEFDENTQALAGGVFNTVAQIGKSVGIALAAVVASSVTAVASSQQSHEEQLLKGYRAAWWFTFASIVVCTIVTFVGLRGLGKVGMKQE